MSKWFTETVITWTCLFHCVGDPDLFCPGSFPPWCKWSHHPNLHRAATRSPHPLPSNLCPHLLQPHYLYPYHLHRLPQQCARHAAASLHLKPPAARRIPATKLLRQREDTDRGRVVLQVICWLTDYSCTAQTRSYIILMWFYFWFCRCCCICEPEQCSCKVRHEGHSGLHQTVCGQILRHQAERWDQHWGLGNLTIGLCVKTQLLPQLGSS